MWLCKTVMDVGKYIKVTIYVNGYIATLHLLVFNATSF